MAEGDVMAKFGTKKPRSYIKPKDDLKTGDKILFVTGAKWEEKDFSQDQDGSKMEYVCVTMVSVNGGETKELLINSTCGNSLAELWGEEGPAWKDKIATVSFVKVSVRGKLQDTLCLVPTEEKLQTTWEEEEK